MGRRTLAIPGWLRRLLYDRDPSCQFPGCANWRWTDGHHLIHWAHGGATDLDNLIRLCRVHHTIVQNLGVGIASSFTHRAWTFYRPDGSLIEPAPHLPGGTPDNLPVGAPVSLWEEDPARLRLIIDGLLKAQEEHDVSAETSATAKNAEKAGHCQPTSPTTM